MPRMLAFRVGVLWVACALNDYDEATGGSFGLTREGALDRALRRTGKRRPVDG